MNQVTFTKITSDHGQLTKTMTLADDSRIIKKASAQLHRGHYERVTVNGLQEFADQLVAATAADAFCYGVTTELKGRLVRENDLAENAGAIARTRNHFGLSRGPGILMLDNDDGQIFKGSFVEHLWDSVSILDGVSMLGRPSSSSNLYHAKTNECLRPMINQRAYLIASDASRIPVVGNLIEASLWLAGEGYYDISTAGTLLKRCTVDTSVWQPERLDFVGGAVCVPPLEQRHMGCEFIEGHQAMLNVRHLPRITPQQLEQIKKLEQRAKAAVDVDRLRIHAAWVERRTEVFVSKGVKPDDARRAVEQAAAMQTLSGTFIITMENGVEITVAEILSDPEKYHGQRCHDPLEPDYHDDHRVGFISLKNGGRPFIYSHAHGGARYHLKRPPKTIQILTGESARCTDEISQYLSDQGEVYERGQVLLDVNQDGQTRILNTAGIKYLAGSACNLVRHDQRSNKLKPTDLPDTVAQLIGGRGGQGVFRKLTGVVSAPTMMPSGRIISVPGYDPETGLLFLDNRQVTLPKIINRPNNTEIQAAYEELWYPVKDFPCDSDASRSCLLAALLTSVVRSCLPTAPAFGFDAPTQGSGKTKLAQCVAALGTGRVESLFPPPSDDEETRKKIATALAKSRSVLIFDNMETQLKSPVLAALLTSRVWSDRLLGGNTEIEADNRMLVLITGNNLAPVGDIVRRLLTIRIDPKLEASEVWKREFTIDPLDYIVRNRQQLVASALTLLSGYVAAGRPKMTPGRLASFEEWDDLIRQPIVWLGQQGVAGLCDPITSLTEAAASDPDAMRLADLAHQWHSTFGSAGQSLNEVVCKSELRDVLKDIAIDRQGFPNSRILAAYLSKRVGKIVAGYRFERHNGRSNTSLWRVVGPEPGNDGFGGSYGSVLAHPAKDIKIIHSIYPLATETDPSNPPQPPRVTGQQSSGHVPGAPT